MRISCAVAVMALVMLAGCRLKKQKAGADAGAASVTPVATGATAGKAVMLKDIVYFSEPGPTDPDSADASVEDDAGSPVVALSDAGSTNRVTVPDAGRSATIVDAGASKPDAGAKKATPSSTKPLVVMSKGATCPAGYVKRSADPMCHLSCPPECPAGAKCSNLICSAAQ